MEVNLLLPTTNGVTHTVIVVDIEWMKYIDSAVAPLRNIGGFYGAEFWYGSVYPVPINDLEDQGLPTEDIMLLSPDEMRRLAPGSVRIVAPTVRVLDRSEFLWTYEAEHGPATFETHSISLEMIQQLAEKGPLANDGK